MDGSKKDIDVAIADLKVTIEKLNKKMTALTDRTNELRQLKARYVSQEVEMLLPDLNPRRIELLEKQLPRFFTPDVEEIFATPKGWQRLIGVFIETRNKKQDLKFLQVKLRALIDGMSAQQLQTIVMMDPEGSKNLSDVVTELAKPSIVGKLVEARSKLKEQLSVLQKIKDMKAGAKKSKAVPVKVAPVKKTTTVERNTYHDDDVDHLMSNLFWINMLISDHGVTGYDRGEPVFQGAGGNFSGAGASGGWDQGTTSSAPVNNQQPMLTAAIATDDSLGRFS